MLKFNPEELKQLNYGPEDSEKMKQLTRDQDEILKRAHETEIVEEAKTILKKATLMSDLRDRNIAFDDEEIQSEKFPKDELEKIEELREKIDNELFDDSSDFFTAVDKDSTEELFFKLLAEEFPELNVSVDEQALNNGEPLAPWQNGVKSVPFKTDRKLLFDLGSLPIVSFLEKPFFETDLVQELHDSGVLSAEMINRIFIRDCQKQLHFCKKMSEVQKDMLAHRKDALYSVDDLNYWDRQVGEWEEELQKYGDSKALSDEEAKELMRNAVKEELKKRLGM